MHCTNCGTQVADLAAFCPNCGTSLTRDAGADSQTLPRDPVIPVTPAYFPQPEERIRRAVAYLIDVIPMLLLAFLHLLPIFGWMLYGLIHVLYWLLRDINGASLGKLVMGTFVASTDGTPASTQQRILRNVTLALPGLFGIIPLVGLFVEGGLAFFIVVLEAIVLLATGRRIGDRLANTSVFRKVTP